MLPYLRSVVAQVHRKSLPIGPRRSFSSDPSIGNAPKVGAGEGVSGYFGFKIGGMILGDVVADLMEKEEKAKQDFAEDAEIFAFYMGRKV
ncbi:unnamed protein product [Microthlaspi erraticum]|uniref:Uncharacterized protein n=1 Tax=Microthlaspi erraticum TaxID=1685480 RepID=A0A6D2J171_9BRAS|nr:unnamed protein product [Microthlaspi erraticum]